MSSRVDIKVAPSQGDAIKEVHRVGHQIFERKRFKIARDRKEEEKKKETGPQRFADSYKGRVRNDERKGGPGSDEQHSDSGNKAERKKSAKVRGGLVDVMV
jgi:hypothetical protein